MEVEFTPTTNLVSFEELSPGACFESNGAIFVVTSDEDAVRLSDGEVFDFEGEESVISKPNMKLVDVEEPSELS